MTAPARMKFGIFMAPFHRVGENPTLALERDLELLQWLDQLGLTKHGSASTTARAGRPSPRLRCLWLRLPSARATCAWARAWSACLITTPIWWRTAWCCWIT